MPTPPNQVLPIHQAAIRSHAQKYFLKVQKSGTSDHLPPPRPKRKAAHPYPQKASNNVPVILQVSGSFQTPSSLLESGIVLRPDSSSTLTGPITGAAVSSWTNNGPIVANNCCSSTESTLRLLPTVETIDKGNHNHPFRALPDFAQVYSFIGSVFDPNATGTLQRLKKMDPIDVETVLLLMRNLSINLTSPDFEDHRRLMSSYEIDTDTTTYGEADKALYNDPSKNAAQHK